MFRRGLPRAVAGLLAAVSTGIVGGGYLAASPASAITVVPLPPPPSFTWTGQGLQSDTNGDVLQWSNPANWSGGSAPNSATGASTLTFPDLGNCDPTLNACSISDDDISTLSVNKIDMPAGSTSYTLEQDPTTPGTITLGGGGISVTGTGVQFVSIPLTLGADQTWSVATANLQIGNPLTGVQALTTTLGNGGDPNQTGGVLGLSGDNELGAFTVNGADTTQSAGNNGSFNLPTNLNGTNGNAVNINHVQVIGPSQVGALHISSGQFFVGDGFFGSSEITNANSVSLDSASSVDFDIVGHGHTAGTDFSQLASTGAVDLGGAQLLINPNPPGASSCLTPNAGDSWPIVTAPGATGTSITGEFSDSNGNLIPNGGVVDFSDCNGNPTSPYRIDYTSSQVTATAVAPTTTTLSAAPASPQAGQTDIITATVSASPSSEVPAGTVAFADHDGNDVIPGCEARPLSNTPPYQATCTTTFGQSGENGLGAEFTPSATSNVSPSQGGIPFTVNPIPGAASSNAATATPPSTSATAADSGVTATASGGQGTVVVSKYNSDPVGAPTFSSDGDYFDVKLDSGATFSSVTVESTGLPSNAKFYWWNASNHTWNPVVGDPGPGPVPGQPASTQSFTLTGSTSPNLSQITGTVFGVGTASTPPPPPPAGPGYRFVASDGGVFDFAEPFYGSAGGANLVAPIVGMANAVGGKGYYLAASDGGIFNYGPGSRFQGSLGGIKLTQPIVGIATDPATGGYWLVAADGGVFSFNAPFYGSTGGIKLDKPIVGISATPDGHGYYLVASDGGIFAFGPSAHFQGSTGGIKLTKPVVGMSVDPQTGGYRLVATDGGLFSFNAPFHGSTGGVQLVQPVVGMATDPATGGYWLVAADGGIFSFDAPFRGSTGDVKLVRPIVGMAAG